MRHLGTAFVVIALLVGAYGVGVFVTERGVANEIAPRSSARNLPDLRIQ